MTDQKKACHEKAQKSTYYVPCKSILQVKKP